MAKRRPRPAPRWQERMAQASDPGEELSAAYDALRSSLARLARKRRDKAAEESAGAAVAATVRETAAYLSRLAAAVRERDQQMSQKVGDAA